MSCLSCLDDEVELFVCKKCNAGVCFDCFLIQFNIFKKEMQMPECCGCKNQYVYSDFNKSKCEKFKSLENEFINAVYNFTISNNEWFFINKKNKHDLVEKILIKRIQTIEQMPLCVNYIIKKYMFENLKKIDKDYETSIVTQIENSKVKCYNFTCDGVLNNKNKCLLCDAVFCYDCENPRDLRHECDPEDLKTIEDLRLNTVKCPKCGVRIHKSQGCNSMTCTVCHCNFLYNNPVLSSDIYQNGGGNKHNTPLNITIIKSIQDVKYNVSENDYENVEYLKYLLDIIISMDKNVLKVENILKHVKLEKLYKIDENIDIIEKIKTFSADSEKLIIVKELEKIENSVKYFKLYAQVKKNIISYFHKKDLHEDKLKKYIKVLKNYK